MLKKAPNGKAADEDSVRLEFIKYGHHQLQVAVVDLLNNALINGVQMDVSSVSVLLRVL